MPLSWEEVIHALKHMHPQKVAGPDDMHAYFFYKYLHLVGDDVVLFALKVLNDGLDLLAVNHTYISLILKIQNPTVMAHYWAHY